MVDDSLDTYTRVRDVFGSHRPVRFAHTVVKALDILDEQEVAILITDVIVSGEDVTDFIKLLKQQYPLLMAIVLTEAADASVAIELINQGQIFRYLRKPIGDTTLRMSIHQGLRFYQTHKTTPELLQRHQVEVSESVSNSSLAGRLMGRLKSLRQRFGFSFSFGA